jgi:two-component system CheB/CheR fusion protein
MSVPSPPRLPDLAGLTILIVDDNDDAIELLSTFLKACGAVVLIARSALGALTYIDMTPKLDVVVTDISMPLMDGVELTRKVRAHPTRRSLPMIALTGFYEDYPNTEHFDAYLRKPIDFEHLTGVIRHLTRR